MKHCLIVDDSRVVRTVAGRIVKDLSFTVSEAAHGAEALEICREKMPDAILLDWNMPVMNGLEVARQLRSDRNDLKFPIIGLTGHSGSQEIDACLQAGMDRVLSKPVNQAELVSLMVDLLNRERKAS